MFDTATGMLVSFVPDGPQRDELLGLVRIGIKFDRQHIGKRPGALSRLVLNTARDAGPPYSFESLLDGLERLAARREIHGETASCVERVDRVWCLMTIHLPKKGRVQVSFGTVRNHLSAAKKSLSAEFPLAAKP